MAFTGLVGVVVLTSVKQTVILAPGGLALVAYGYAVLRTVRAGVQETSDGIVCIASGRQWGSAHYKWSEMTAFSSPAAAQWKVLWCG